MSRTRIAVAGAGFIGRDHIAAALSSASVELAAVVDPLPAAAELAATAGVAHYPDLDTLFSADQPDGVVLATPNQLHYDQALACMSAGVPALLEKPLTATLDEGERLYAEATRREATILVGHHRTHSPIMRLARQVVASGRLGRIVAVTGSALFHKPEAYFTQAPWRTRPGAGPILLNLIHEVHNLRILCGEITGVQAYTSDAVRGFEVEDTAAIALRFAGGALGTFVISDTVGSGRSWEQTAAENPAYAQYPDEDCYHLAGTLGSLSVPSFRLKTFDGTAEHSWSTPLSATVLERDHEDPIIEQMEHFGAVVRGEVQPLCTVADGLMNMRVVAAVKESAAAGVPVTVPGLPSAPPE